MPDKPHAHVLDEKTEVEEFNNLGTTDWAEFSHSLSEFRIRYGVEGARGLEEFYCVREGIFVRTLDIRELDTAEPVKGASLAGQLVFAFKLEGENAFQLDDGRRHEVKPGTLTLAYSEEDEIFDDVQVSGDRYLMTCLLVNPDILLASPFSLTQETLPEFIKGVFDHRPGLLLESLPIDMGMVRSLQDLLTAQCPEVFVGPLWKPR